MPGILPRVALFALVAFALASEASAQAHPRVLFRGKPPELPWRDRLDDLRETPPGLALHWAYTGDDASARACRAALLAMEGDEGYGLSAAGAVLYLPVAYDWLYAWKGWTAADRKTIEGRIERTAESCRDFLAGRDDHVFHTSAPRAVMGVGLAALVLEGHHAKAAEWLAFTREYLEKTYLPAIRFLDGGAVAGMSYAVNEGFFPLGVLLSALKSAKGLDYFAREKSLARILEYTIHSLLPDQTFLRWGDIVGGGRASTRDEARCVIDMFASGLDSRDGFAASAGIDRRWPSHGYHAEVLWLAPFFARESRNDVVRLPPTALFGRDSVGHAFFRSGWDEDATCVFFKCGDYFDDHGHFDQGSFTIWRREHLAVRSFAYGGFNEPHRLEFGRRTVAHSTLLIGAGDAVGGQRIVRSQDSQDVADYQSKKKAKDLETGDVIGWEAQKGWTYLAADLTAAYERNMARRVTRELVWLDGRTLIVLDRVEAAAPARWLLHLAAAPRIDGNAFLAEGEKSSLAVTTLLPEKPRIQAVKGWIADGKDYPPDSPGEFHVPGGHRVEVTGGAVFLHVLTAVDAGQAAPRPKRASGPETGVEISGTRILFPRAPGGKPRVESAR